MLTVWFLQILYILNFWQKTRKVINSSNMSTLLFNFRYLESRGMSTKEVDQRLKELDEIEDKKETK